MMNPPDDDDTGWEKPSIYSVAVIALVFALIGYGLYAGKLTWTESLGAAVLGVITWVTRGARPPAVNKIGPKPPAPTRDSPVPMIITAIPESGEPPRGRGPPPAAMMLLLLPLMACTPGEGAKDVLSVISVACIIANATSDDATILKACGVADALLPSVRTILGEHRKALAAAQRAGCGGVPSRDAGAP